MENKTSFYDVDYNEMDRDLSPEQLQERTDIYAFYHSWTPLTDTAVSANTHRLAMHNPEPDETETRNRQRNGPERILQCNVLVVGLKRILEVNLKPYFSAEKRHPVDSMRKGGHQRDICRRRVLPALGQYDLHMPVFTELL